MKIKNHNPAAVPYKPFLMKWLKDPRACFEYLNAALEDGDEKTLLLVLRDLAEAQGGFSRLAKLSKIHRVTLHRILSQRGNPKLQNLVAIMQALGLKLAIVPDKKPYRIKRAA